MKQESRFKTITGNNDVVEQERDKIFSSASDYFKKKDDVSTFSRKHQMMFLNLSKPQALTSMIQ